LGTKYDQFQDTDAQTRKFVTKALRYIALVNGASIVFSSKEDETLVTKVPDINYLILRFVSAQVAT
jgi:dynein light intermediate chain 2